MSQLNTPNLSLVVHGATAIAVIVAATILALQLKTIPADVAGLFGVILGVTGTNGANAVRAATSTDTQPNKPPLQGGPVQ